MSGGTQSFQDLVVRSAGTNSRTLKLLIKRLIFCVSFHI